MLLALNGAQRKLQSAECRSILTAFRDDEGRPLDERLASLEVQPAASLGLGENPPTSTEINETLRRRCGW